MSLPKYLYIAFFVCLPSWLIAQNQEDSYQFTLDIARIFNDKLSVTLQTPRLSSNEVVYRIPKIVPGTYRTYDFGRFVENFVAYDKNNQPLPVVRIDTNSWRIAQAQKLHKITYKVSDTYDAPANENFVFPPAGTSYESDVVLLNWHGILGYFDGHKSKKYKLTIHKPTSYYGATALVPVKSTPQTDVFEAASYMDISDAPIMYSQPDTASVQLSETKVLVAVHSKNGQRYAETIASELSNVLKAIEKFLGGSLPVRKYAFIIYLSPKPSPNGVQGALEHSFSSAYYLLETTEEALAQEMRAIGAHEFMHIVTPLGLHSEEISDFDYNTPKMSRHLWLYEGVTEYNSSYVQLRDKMMSTKEFFNSMKLKMSMSEQLFTDSLSFTEMSQGVLTEYADEYSNVYEKGAIMAWCLDLQIRYYSEGKQGLQDVITTLTQKYGAKKPFKDEALIAEIVALTHPEIGNFFKKHIEGATPLPIKESLAMMGFEFEREIKKKEPSLGKISLEYRGNKEVAVSYVGNMNEFGRNMGWQVGDVLVEFQGEAVRTDNIEAILANYRANTAENQTVKAKVTRLDNKGEKKTVTLKAKAKFTETTEKYRIAPLLNPSALQLKVRNAWLTGSVGQK